MHRHILPSIILIAFVSLLSVIPIATAQQEDDSVTIHLRRASFDPLQSVPVSSATRTAETATNLFLVQLTITPDTTTMDRLRESGMIPLMYIPDQTFLVRITDSAQATLNASWIRWVGPYEPDYKLPTELDSMAATTQSSHMQEMNVLAASDANMSELTAQIDALGGSIVSQHQGMHGITLSTQMPEAAVSELLTNNDVLWIEPDIEPRLHNKKGREITGVTAAREQLSWLTGKGQIVAVTDTGLDVQSDVSADFAGRVEAGFSPNAMYDNCQRTNWDDYNGHGTHVAGTVLGNGTLSDGQHTGMAPEARLVVQTVSSGGNAIDCLLLDNSFLVKAYNAGARIQNASWGGPTGGSVVNPEYGGYDLRAEMTDQFLWNHKDHLLVVAAGNDGEDNDLDGVIDRDSMNSPATAKNVLSVGMSESERTNCTSGGYCGTWGTHFFFSAQPIKDDRLSDNRDGIAALSSRGPTDDGRIKPEIVAPGTNIVSARSNHASAGIGWGEYNDDYVFNGGTSMSAPMISGLAALTRQWLTQEQGFAAPSAALVKAMLLNGAVNLSPGQYGTGEKQEIPDAWPNNVQGWGRADISRSLGINEISTPWLVDDTTGLETSQVVTYKVPVTKGQPFRVTLAWTDYPMSPLANKALVNDLDLEIITPNEQTIRGNHIADLPSNCRNTNNADRCNNIESIEIAQPESGEYTIVVRGTTVAQGGQQPFAIVANPQIAQTITSPELSVKVSEEVASATLTWDEIAGVSYYEIQQSTQADFSTIQETIQTKTPRFTLVTEQGTFYYRVRACNTTLCGEYSNIITVTNTVTPHKVFAPLIVR
ncbi:MAG: S8 family serine peptidase [Chloroflexota bacterium]